jgi:hypothetical protein
MLFGRREKPRFFVKTQGFEKRFFLKNLVKYFGDDIAWSEAVDMDTVRLTVCLVGEPQLTLHPGLRRLGAL